MDSAQSADTSRATSPSWWPCILIGIVGLLVGFLVVNNTLRGADNDPYVFAAVGEVGYLVEPIEEVAGREVVTRANLGHDGKFYLILAFDPFLMDSTNVAAFDAPMYRAQRIGFPLLAGLGGLLPDQWVIWAFPVLHVLALGAGSVGTARLAQRLGVTPLLGLAFALNPAMLMVILIGTGGIIALASAIWATLALEGGRVWSAAALMTLSVLSRETMFAYLGGLCLVALYRNRRIPWALGLPPTLVFAGWMGYLLTIFPPEAYVPKRQALNFPLVGLIQAVPYWRDYDAEKLVFFVGIFATLAAAVLLLGRFRNSYIGAGMGMFILLALTMGSEVWREPFDASRGIAPVFTCVALLGALDRQLRKSEAGAEATGVALAGS